MGSVFCVQKPYKIGVIAEFLHIILTNYTRIIYRIVTAKTRVNYGKLACYIVNIIHFLYVDVIFITLFAHNDTTYHSRITVLGVGICIVYWYYLSKRCSG
jgi:hypothetical protein